METRKVLVVDDDPLLRELLVQTLQAIGHSAKSASDGVAALAELQTESYDVVVSDIRMPQMDGIELLRQIRDTYPSLPVLFISGFASTEILDRSAPDGFLTKPFRIHQVEDMIAKVTSPERKRSIDR